MSNIHKSVDPTWVRWGVSSPTTHTHWFRTLAEAQAFAGVKARGPRCPDFFRFWTAGEVINCVNGIAAGTEQELEAATIAAANGKARPLGGDGSNGTTEEPIVSCGEYGDDLPALWRHLSDDAKADLIAAAKRVKAESGR